MFVLDISLFPGKQSGGWQQQGVSLENNKHQNDKSWNLVVLPQKLFLRINWIASERLWFLLISLLKVASLDFCRSLSVVFSAVSLLCASIRTHRPTAAAAEADCCQPCPAWPTLNVSRIREGLFQPAKEKPLSVASVVREKIKQLTKSTTTAFQFSFFLSTISLKYQQKLIWYRQLWKLADGILLSPVNINSHGAGERSSQMGFEITSAYLPVWSM